MNENQNDYVDINAHDNYPDSEQKIEIPTMKVIPLKKICMTIGELPSSYLETMTYYEMLVWFINYLRDNIIPTVNGNAAAVQEVQNVVMELQNYINDYKDSIDSDVEELEEYMNNYFENLDVQEEINNKLDQMLEDGVLEQIIEQFIQSTAIWCFDTVADMQQATNLINGSFARTLGYYSANDCGGATYKITDTESLTDYQEELTSGLYATLIINDYATPEMFGAYGDSEHDDSVAIQKCLDIGKKVELKGNYKTTLALILHDNQIIEGNNYKITNNELVNILRAENINNVVINNLKIEGDVTVGEGQVGISFRNCNNIKITNVDIQNTGGDGIFFSNCKDCILDSAILKNNYISAFAFNSYNVVFTNLDIYTPRFQYGLQFKSCNDSTMSNILIDTPKDIGIFVNKGNEEDANDTANITVDNVKVINEGQNGTLTSTIRCAIVMANGTNFILNKAITLNSAYSGIYMLSSNSIINDCITINNNGIGIQTSTGNNVTISNCVIENNTISGITSSINKLKIVNSTLKNNGTDGNHGNLTIDTSDNIIISNNTFIMESESDTTCNIRNIGTLTNTRIINNNFINEKTGSSYADYKGNYDYTTGVFANNGKTRLYQVRGNYTLDCYATIQNGNVTIDGYRNSIPNYTGFSDGDIFINRTGTNCIGWICKSETWYPFGAIIT